MNCLKVFNKLWSLFPTFEDIKRDYLEYRFRELSDFKNTLPRAPSQREMFII